MIEPDLDNPDLLIGEPKAEPRRRSPHDVAIRRRIGILVGALLAIPTALTLAGALTSPPHAKSVPTGHLIYLEADEPSDHTTILRGLRSMDTQGASHQLLHEIEPQDRDAGSREWISQPASSPDGHWLAFEKQMITLQEEQQSIDNQLWVMPLAGPRAQPRMLLDLTKAHLKQFVGLTWTPDSSSVVFLQDAATVTVPISGIAQRGRRWTTAQGPAVNAAAGSWLPSVVFQNGKRSASVTAADPHLIQITEGGTKKDVTARWGWSVFGGRRITALKWSPDGKFLAYSVSKPPLEDELFDIDLATGKCSQLPVRTGRAGWDWAP